MSKLYIIRGLPGSGKSTLACELSDYVCEADDYFTDENGIYHFDPTKLPEAHENCLSDVEAGMNLSLEKIAVSNTFSRRWEFAKYRDLANLYGYSVVEITMSGPLFPNVHGVPYDTVQNMRSQWES
jgi:predicted kinase